MSQKGPETRPQSELAKIYSHPYDPTKFGRPLTGDTELNVNHKALDGTLPLKSGLTPLDEGPFTLENELRKFEEWTIYQRTRFRGKISENLVASC